MAAIGRKKSIVQVSTDVGDPGDRHVCFVQIHDPYLTGLFERNHEDIGARRAGDHARVGLDHFSIRIDGAQSDQLDRFQGFGIHDHRRVGHIGACGQVSSIA